MVRVAVAALAPVTLAEAAEQVGLAAVRAPLGAEVTEQVKATVPVKPATGVAVMVEVPVAPCEAIVTAVPASVKLGGIAVTVTAMTVVAVRLPEVPVTDRVYAPAAVELLVLMVSEAVAALAPVTLAEAVEQVGLSAVTAPEGAEVTAQVSATEPVNPFAGVAVIVEVPVAPGEAMVTAEPVRENTGGGTTFTATAVVAVRFPEMPVTVTL